MNFFGEDMEGMVEAPEGTVGYMPFLPTYDIPMDTIKLYRLDELLEERVFVLFCVKTLSRSTQLSLMEKREKLIEILRKHSLNHHIWLLTHNGVDPGTEEHQRHIEDERFVHLYVFAVFVRHPVIIDFLTEQEKMLFVYRTLCYEIDQVMEFLETNKMPLAEATEQDKEGLQHELDLHWTFDEPRDPTEPIYQVPWFYSANVFRSGSVLLHKGLSYVPKSKLKEVLPEFFDRHLENERKTDLYGLAAKLALSADQIVFLRASLIPTFWIKYRYTRFLKFDMRNFDKEIDSFPPCIRTILDSWTKTNHLKYESRKQLWRFFNGLQTDPDALIMRMRSTFKVSEKKMKGYIYEMKHSFGLVGSKIQYETPDCSSYNHGPTRVSEVDGCPFADFESDDIEDLGTKLTAWSIPPETHAEILDYKSRGSCSNACGAFFTAVHGVEPKQPILNPLDFYSESRKVLGINSTEEPTDDELSPEFFDKLFASSTNRHAYVLDKETRLETIREYFDENPCDKSWNYTVDTIKRMDRN
ncbi:DNA primase large subunit-like [Diachasmimorpha longicaudata]|uniref:DNA primase large subunit-like n=1 Tax=Diachasmimorpha longicaudata TaxID=58733 RepID=UPI0030B902B5